jgi:N,N-dimethylformamidase
MLPITGYLDRLSARPGERIEVKVSSELAEDYRADLVRIVHADPNPAGPGSKVVELPHAMGTFPSRRQQIVLGSYGRVDGALPITDAQAFTVSCLVWPTLPDDGAQALVATLGESGPGLALGVGPRGAWFEIGSAQAAAHRIETGSPLAARRWYRIWASFDPASGTMAVAEVPFASRGAVPRVASARVEGGSAAKAGPLFLAARPGTIAYQHFNGRLEDPALLGFAAGNDGTSLDPRLGAAPLLAWWDFAQGIDTQSILDRGPFGLAGQLINLPTRAVRGARWNGSEMCWRHAPEHYACIHFHDDDLGDCRWATDFVLKVPRDLRSGVYGVRLRCAGHEEILPFYVLPERGKPTAPVLFLAPTFTYQAYFNHARGNTDDAFFARVKDWRAYPHNADQHPEYGRSTYNRHRDGSGICYSTRHRPTLTLRPNYLTFNDPRGSGLRHFSGDSHLTDWLEAKGIAYDVATDEDLDNEGAALLEPYRVVLTGSHPEYHTSRTLDALLAYRDGGGRFVYLGGNGFYWKIARNPALADTIEIRRAEGGIRAWAAEPGEYYNSLDGGYGGLWRRNGRDPQQLCGVGFTSQGLFEGSYYRRLPAASDPRASWIFRGVDAEILGDFGLSGGGAAGFELDRADVRLGTPPHALVLARSERHQPHFILVLEEQLSHVNTLSGEPYASLIRADMVFFETPKGGAVFSVGSITFCGSLSHNNYDNPISRLLENVVRRFADPAPFAMPK